MTKSSNYARFDCRTCGETVYSPILGQKESLHLSDKPLELTCSGGHTDQYRAHEVQIVDSKPTGKLKFKYASAVGL